MEHRSGAATPTSSVTMWAVPRMLEMRAQTFDQATA